MVGNIGIARVADYHCTITTTLRSFISCIDQKAAFKEYTCDGDNFEEYLDVEFYANGYCDQNEGYVSIIFKERLGRNSPRHFYPEKISCVASVIDAYGNKRFMRSFGRELSGRYTMKELLSPSKISFGFNQFIQRSTLLRDSSELLPDGSLTLHIEMDSQNKTSGSIHPENDAFWLLSSQYDNIYCFLAEGQHAFDKSPFKIMTQKKVSIPPEDENTFSFLLKIIREDNFIVSGDEIYNLYLFADKYDMQLIIETCHKLLLCMVLAIRTRNKCSRISLKHFAESIQKYFELAERFTNDIVLRKILRVYSDIQLEVRGFGRNLAVSNLSDHESDWSCEFLHDVALETYSIHFSKIKIADPLMDIFR